MYHVQGNFAYFRLSSDKFEGIFGDDTADGFVAHPCSAKFLLNRFTLRNMHRALCLLEPDIVRERLFPQPNPTRRPLVDADLEWRNRKLNGEQRSAVHRILDGGFHPAPYVIFGPPGTGKTATLIEAALQVYKRFPSAKLLLCAQTNAVVDKLTEKMLEGLPEGSRKDVIRPVSNKCVFFTLVLPDFHT